MKPSPGQIVIAVAMTVVVASIIAGVLLVGSPAEGPVQRLEAGRIDDTGGMGLDARPVMNPCHMCHPGSRVPGATPPDNG